MVKNNKLMLKALLALGVVSSVGLHAMDQDPKLRCEGAVMGVVPEQALRRVCGPDTTGAPCQTPGDQCFLVEGGGSTCGIGCACISGVCQ